MAVDSHPTGVQALSPLDIVHRATHARSAAIREQIARGTTSLGTLRRYAVAEQALRDVAPHSR